MATLDDPGKMNKRRKILSFGLLITSTLLFACSITLLPLAGFANKLSFRILGLIALLLSLCFYLFSGDARVWLEGRISSLPIKKQIFIDVLILFVVATPYTIIAFLKESFSSALTFVLILLGVFAIVILIRYGILRRKAHV